MTEQELNSETMATVDTSTNDYIETIKTLKQTTVDRAQYDQLRAENKKLLDSIVNGTPVEVKAEPKKSLDELRAAYLKEDQTNLDQIKATLEYREALIESGQPDPFLPVGKQIMPTDEDIAAANRVASVLAECVDYAEGDSNVFTNELQRRVVDIKIR